MEKTIQKQSIVNSLKSHKFLLLSIIVVIILNLISNLFEKSITGIIGNLLYIPITAVMIIFSLKWFFKSDVKGTKNRIGGLFLLLALVSWSVAEYIWIVLDLALHQKTFPSLADVFYLSGYLFMFTFLSFLIFPLRNLISLKNKIFATTVSLIFIISTVFMTYQVNAGEDQFSLLLSLSYPVIDSLLLFPCVVGVLAFRNTTMSNAWIWLLIGSMFLLIGDTIFSGQEANGSYYVGNPSEVFFYCAYIMFAYSAYYSLRHQRNKDLLAEEVEAISASPKMESNNDTVDLTIMGSVAVVILFLVVSINGFKSLSSAEIQYYLPLIITGIVFAISTRLLTIKISADIKKSKRDMHMKKMTLDYQHLDSTNDQAMLSLRERIETLEKNRRKMIPFLFVSMMIIVITITYYITTVTFEDRFESQELSSGRFTIQNLKGDVVNTWVTWDLVKDEPLHITLVNHNILTDDKINAIENAILSEQTIKLKNSLTGKSPADSSEIYYEGWTGALKAISTDHTKLYTPTKFVIREADDATGDIVIILSTDIDADGTLGFTKVIADEQTHQLLKSFITIFGVDKLSDDELTAIVRHEFGHALGIGHSNAGEDLMNPHFKRNIAYISQCDVDALKSLYNESGNTEVTCSS